MGRPVRPLIPAMMLMLTIGLAGCFNSEEPLINAENASFPFETITLETEDGIMVLEREGDAYFGTEKGKGKGKEPILFHRLDENLYIVQSLEKGGSALYLFAKVDGDRVTVKPECQDVDENALVGVTIEIMKGGKGAFRFCRFKNLRTLAAVGKSQAIWSGKTTNIQILSKE